MRKQNCLGFVLGTTSRKTATIYPASFGSVPHNPDVVESVCNRLQELGFNCRKVENPNASLFNGEELMAFWGFYPIHEFWGYSYEFHVAMRDARGIWCHKNGWEEEPCCFDLEEFIRSYGAPTFFAIQKRAP